MQVCIVRIANEYNTSMYILYTPRIFAATSNSDIVCKTEKDRTRVHDRTAGDFKSDMYIQI